jgi:hypothetical protein
VMGFARQDLSLASDDIAFVRDIDNYPINLPPSFLSLSLSPLFLSFSLSLSFTL